MWAGSGQVSLGLDIGGGARGKILQAEKGRGSLEGAFKDVRRKLSQLFGTELLVCGHWLPRGAQQVLKCQLLHSLVL